MKRIFLCQAFCVAIVVIQFPLISAPRQDYKGMAQHILRQKTETNSTDENSLLFAKFMTILGLFVKIMLYRDEPKIAKQHTSHLIDEIVEVAKIATRLNSFDPDDDNLDEESYDSDSESEETTEDEPETQAP